MGRQGSVRVQNVPFQMVFNTFAFTMASLFSFFASSFVSTSAATLGAPRPWQRGFQTPASPLAEGIIAFHDDLRIFLVGILCFVRFVLSTVLSKYSHRHSTDGRPVERLVHASTLEIVWTIVPALILVVIAIPSFSLLYSLDEVIEPLLTFKVIGHQWYWSYEFLDPEVIARLYNNALTDGVEGSNIFEAHGSGAFDSYRLSEEDTAAGKGLSSIRLLTVDNHLVLPTERHLRARVTSADVIHS